MRKDMRIVAILASYNEARFMRAMNSCCPVRHRCALTPRTASSMPALRSSGI